MSTPDKPQRFDLAEVARMAMFGGGIALVAYGTWLIHEPAGYIAAGLMMFGCAVVGAYRAGSGS